MTHISDLAGVASPCSYPYPPWAVLPHVLTAAFLIAATALLIFTFWRTTRPL